MIMERRAVVPGIVLVMLACGGSGEDVDRLEALFDGELEVVDLTHSLSVSMPYWPNPAGNPFRHDTLSAHADGAPRMAAYFTPEHHGTHLDAPVHGAVGRRSVDQLRPIDLWGPAVVIDIADLAANDPDHLLSVEDVTAWEREHGVIPAGAVVLLATGWGRKWTDPESYRNLDADGRLRFPGFSPDAARFLVEERDIRGLGIDNMSVDYGLSTDFAVHGITHGAGKYHLENLANLHRLPPTGAYLIVAPVKIEGGSGGQVRVYAVLP